MHLTLKIIHKQKKYINEYEYCLGGFNKRANIEICYLFFDKLKNFTCK